MRYEDVPADEAIDLVEALPDGSAWAARTDPLRSWSPERHRDADLLDAVEVLVWYIALDKAKTPEPPRAVRPLDRLRRAMEAQRARAAREEIGSDDWEEM